MKKGSSHQPPLDLDGDPDICLDRGQINLFHTIEAFAELADAGMLVASTEAILLGQ